MEDTGEVHRVPLKVSRLRRGAIPSILPNCPAYLSSERPTSTTTRETVKDRNQRKELNNLQIAINQSILSETLYKSQKQFSTFSEFLICLNNSTCINKDWITVKREKSVAFIFVSTENIPTIALSAVLDNNLELTLYYKQNIQLKKLGSQQFPRKVNDINDLENILEKLLTLNTVSESSVDIVLECVHNALLDVKKALDGDSKKQKKIEFLIDQINLVNSKPGALRYSPHSLIFCSILFTVSPHAYKFLRHSDTVTFPHPRTLQNLCSKYNTSPQLEQLESNFLCYIREKYTLLGTADHIVTLMIDEIHIKPFFDYKGGNIVGSSYNTENAATTAHVFMIQSLLSPYKDVVHILPVKTINAEQLFTVIKKIILRLHEIGFNILCVVSDNNSINRKAIAYFSSPPELKTTYSHPFDNSLPLFYVLDSVHIYKCIRNNWINQKDSQQTLVFPDFNISDNNLPGKACFASIKRLHEIENQNLLKYSYGLNLKSLCPSTFERQNVKLVMNIFNEFVQHGLTSLGEVHNIPHFQSTAEFIKIITNWWKIVNVKTPNKGIRHNDLLEQPLTLNPENENLIFLQKFVTWLDTWKSLNLKCNSLTRETHQAISHTTLCLLELSKYCIQNLNFKYFLPGKIQTDALEARFGKYRTMAGSQYLITIRQIFETESKIRIQNLLPLTLNSNTFGKIDIHIEDCDIELEGGPTHSHIGLFEFETHITDDDIKLAESNLPVLTYLAGYCARAALKKMRCEYCSKLLVLDKGLNMDCTYALIRNMDRGGLLCPHPDVVNAILYTYSTVQKLLTPNYEKQFLDYSNQRELVIKLSTEAILDGNFFLSQRVCESGHSSDIILKNIVRPATNALLNNYVKKRNDLPVRVPKKRKINTVNNACLS